MKTRVYIIIIGIIATMSAFAQTFSSQRPANTDPIQSQQIMTTGAAYSGTVYEPFSNTTPSEQTVVGASYSPAKAPGGPRKGFDTGGETGQSEEYPIGDALFPLMLMVILFASDIFFRRQKTVKE